MMGRTRVKPLVAVLAGLVVMAGLSTECRAGYNAVLVGGAPTFDAMADNYVYTYSVITTSSNEEVSAANANFIRFYDFAGYVAGSATAPTGWTASVAATDFPPLGLNLFHGDDAAIPNITFDYNGASPVSGSLGNFVLRSLYPLGHDFKDFVGVSTNTGTVPPTGIQTRLDFVSPAAIPEPTGVISISIGLVLMGLAHKRRRRGR